MSRAPSRTTARRTVRLDGFADLGIVRGPDDSRSHLYPSLGGALEVPAPSGWLIAAEWGYGPRGVNANSTKGTHVVRVSGYKMF
jgi:hypothetical protein